jgi:hypothetical protein
MYTAFYPQLDSAVLSASVDGAATQWNILPSLNKDHSAWDGANLGGGLSGVEAGKCAGDAMDLDLIPMESRAGAGAGAAAGAPNTKSLFNEPATISSLDIHSNSATLLASSIIGGVWLHSLQG